MIKKLFAIAAVVAASAGLYLWLLWIGAGSGTDQVQLIEVPPGSTFNSISENLERRGIISSAKQFKFSARVFGRRVVKAGEYQMSGDMSPRQVAAVLASGKSVQYPVTVPEGQNIFEIATIAQKSGVIDGAEFLKIVRNPETVQKLIGVKATSLEGYLFPETYYVTRYSGASGLVQMMVSKFKENFAKLDRAKFSPLVSKWSAHQIVTLASIIEKETGAPEERRRISSVFHNRLRKPMRLQTDPTVIYGIWSQSGTWNGNISRGDLQRPTAYNTYTIDGLPPGPIANPGLAALQASTNPETSSFYFFVSRNDGTHVFTETLSKHEAAVRDFQLNKTARKGKSWRDLSKRDQSKTEKAN